MSIDRLPKTLTQATLKRYLARHYDGSLESFFEALNKESDRLIRTDLKKARQLTQRTAGLDTLVPPPFKAHLHRIWGRHHHLSGNYKEADALYAQAVRLFGMVGDRYFQAKVRKAHLDVLMYLGRYDEAAATGRAALDYFRRTKADLDRAQVLTNLGNLFHRKDENRKALAYYNRAYAMFETIGNDFAIALVQFNRGNIHANLNELLTARKLYRQSASIYRSLGMDLAAAQADFSLANIAFLAGDYSVSMNAYAVSAEQFRRLGDRRMQALTELDLAEVHLHLNLYSQAIGDALAVADDFKDLGLDYEQAKAYYFAAVGYFALGDYPHAVYLTRQARKMFHREKNRIWSTLCKSLLARIDCREGRTSRALRAFETIAAFYKRTGDIRRYTDTRLARLESLIMSGTYGEASALARGIRKSLKDMAGYQRFLYHLFMGTMHRSRRNMRHAAGEFRAAVGEAEKMHMQIIPDEVRRFFWLDKLAAYNNLAQIYLDAGEHRRALAVLEKAKEALAIEPNISIPEHGEVTLPEEIEAERMRLRSLLRTAFAPVNEGTRTVSPMNIVRSAEHRLWRLERDIRRRSDIPASVTATRETPLTSVQHRLQSNDTLVYFHRHEEQLGAFIVLPDRFGYEDLACSFESLRALLARFYFLTARSTEFGDDADIMSRLMAEISERIWGPLASRLPDGGRLIIVPDGIFNRLPFYLLTTDGGQCLFEQYDIRIFSSAASFVRNAATCDTLTVSRPTTVLAVSDIDLPGGNIESTLIARSLPEAEYFIGEQATRSHFLEALRKDGGIVHVIAHAAQAYENHLFSPILLSDGPVYPFDLLAHPVSSDLVVLSGCQTGDPGLYYNNTSLSLAQTTLLAGAKNVIASYWPVSDAITSGFMRDFYKYFAGGGTVYRSLQAAIQKTRQRTRDIRDWAPFYLISG